MSNDACNLEFQSVLAPFMSQLIQEKRSCGYSYR